MKEIDTWECHIVDEIAADERSGILWDGPIQVRLEVLHDRERWHRTTYLFGGLRLVGDSEPPDDRLSALLFKFSITHRIDRFEKMHGDDCDQSKMGLPFPVIGYCVTLVPSDDHQTNLTADVVDALVGVVRENDND